MRRFSKRLVQLLTLSLLASAGFFSASPALAQLPTPDEPILVVQNSSASDPYQNFVPELLKTEGLNGYQTAQLGLLTASFLSSYDVVILPHLSLTAAEATLFENYVSAGGHLVGFRPDQQLVSVFGVNALGTTLTEAWLGINTASPYGAGLVSQVIRYHGTADEYSLLSATSLATLYSSTTTATSYPAVIVNTYGSGEAVMFTFDLTESIILLRQGNPAQAGYPNTYDGYTTMRASQMFMNIDAGTYWNDMGDGALNDVPQADEELHLFSNAVTLLNASKRPLPRLWYFPNQAMGLALFTGDHHGDPSSNTSSEVSTIESYGGNFQEYLWMDPVGAITSSQVQTWQKAGNTFGVHFDDTAQMDSSGIGGSDVTWSGMSSVISSDLSELKSDFATVSNPTISNRNHYLIWLSNNSSGTADQTAQAELFQSYGIQMDESFSAFPNRWGYMNGSGLPMKFLNTTTGTVVPVYEQSTQYEDDVQLSTDTYSMGWAQAVAQGHYQKSISDSLNKYNTVVTFLFHPDHWDTAQADGGPYQSDAETALSYAEANSMPMWTADNWSNFWTARAGVTISEPTFSSGTLSFSVTGAVADMSLLIPEQSGSNVVSTVTVNSKSTSFTVMTVQGIPYASVAIAAGSNTVTATYATGGSISGTISPSSAVATTTVQVQSGRVTENVSPASNGTYTVGPFPAGTYTVTAGSSWYSFSPSSQSETLSGSNVTGVNFSGAATAPSGETIFTTQTPVIPNESDGAKANYELGTVFTSDVAGQITAIRYWKAASDSGTHTGRIWNSSGTQLTSVTFTNETASGWQQQALATPVSIIANTQYVVSVNTANTYYANTNNGLSPAVVNEDLTAVEGNNGVYSTTPGDFPSSSWEHSNYFRDIVFVPASYSASGTITPTAAGANATVTLSGPVSGTATANSSGSYTFSNLVAGSYTVTPSQTGYVFTPASQNFTISSSSVTGLNFTGAATYSISGTISGAGGNGATVTLSGAGSATATANSSGAFTFTGLVSGSYTVTPSNSGYTFSPASTSVTVSSANVTGVNFSTLYSISGTISGTGGSGATVTLSGAGSATTTANSSGAFTFTGLVNGSYTVTPTNTGYTFSPASSSVTVSSADVTGVNFSAGAQTYSVSGTISGAGGSGATVTLIGSANASVTANSSGVFTFTGVAAGSYTVTPSNTGYTFSPASSSITVSTANVTGVNFSTLYSISGTISGGAGATVTLTGAASASTTANSSGVFAFTGLSNGSYTVTPTMSGMTSSPTSTSVTVSSANVTGVNFTMVAITYTISGTISGTGGSGATVTLSGAASGSTTANSSGAYTFSGLSNGSYTVTPSASGYTFSPTSTAVSISGGSLSGVNFTASAATSESLFTTQTPATTGNSDGTNVNYELGMAFQSSTGGQITAIRFWKDSHETGTHTGNIWSASGTLLASVTFTGETASGWQQQALAIPLSILANTTYVVSVNTGDTYYVDTVEGLESQITNENLSSVVGSNGVYSTTPGDFPTESWESSNYFRDVVFSPGTSSSPYVVSGTVTPSAAAAVATLTLSGGANGATAPNSSGSFSFSGLPNGTYTITPSASGYTFTPASSTVTVSGGNVSGLSFTGTASQSVFTTQTPAETGLSDGSNVNYELGMAFQSSSAGQITAIRFWKDSNETGTHTGHIWSSSGTLLATVTFTNETASGWQVQSLTTALLISANTTYVVSVNTGNTYYVATDGGLASQITNGDLSTIVGNNGLYGSTGDFPTSSYDNSNYFRDVVFVP